VPLANASTFIFTAIVGHLLGEDKINKGLELFSEIDVLIIAELLISEVLIGMTLVLLGMSLCVCDKM